MKTAYKVVSKTPSGEYYSAIVTYNQRIKVKYIPGVWVSPRITRSKLFVFTSLSSAIAWAKNQIYDENYAIWECLVDSLEEPKDRQILLAYTIYSAEQVQHCWKYSLGETQVSIVDTAFCNELKLIKEVYSNGSTVCS